MSLLPLPPRGQLSTDDSRGLWRSALPEDSPRTPGESLSLLLTSLPSKPFSDKERMQWTRRYQHGDSHAPLLASALTA